MTICVTVFPSPIQRVNCSVDFRPHNIKDVKIPIRSNKEVTQRRVVHGNASSEEKHML